MTLTRPTAPGAPAPLAPPSPVHAAPAAPPAADPGERLARVRADLARAERHLARTRSRDSAGIVVSLAATSLTTLVAGSSAALNQAIGTSNWRVTCGIAAGLAAVGAVATGLRQQFSSADRLAKAGACVARLRGRREWRRRVGRGWSGQGHRRCPVVRPVVRPVVGPVVRPCEPKIGPGPVNRNAPRGTGGKYPRARLA
jgi:hypothetical protein